MFTIVKGLKLTRKKSHSCLPELNRKAGLGLVITRTGHEPCSLVKEKRLSWREDDGRF